MRSSPPTASPIIGTDLDFSESELNIAVPLARGSERVGHTLQALADALHAGCELYALQHMPISCSWSQDSIRPPEAWLYDRWG